MERVMYAIGKKTRCQAGDIVRHPPFDKAIPSDVYDLLRASIYLTKEQAELACQICTEKNPVGFVVLVIGEAD